MKDFFGFEIINSRMFWGKEILVRIFWDGLSGVGSFLGIQNNTKIHDKEWLCAQCPHSATNVVQPNLLYHLIPCRYF